MSAFVCNEYHLSILARAAAAAEYLSGTALRMGYDAARVEPLAQILYAENVRSVCYRYSEATDTYPAAVEVDRRALYGHLSPIQVLKAAHCYTYQACETPDYHESEAAKLIERIIAAYTRILPGYEDAQWEMVPNA